MSWRGTHRFPLSGPARVLIDMVLSRYTDRKKWDRAPATRGQINIGSEIKRNDQPLSLSLPLSLLYIFSTWGDKSWRDSHILREMAFRYGTRGSFDLSVQPQRKGLVFRRVLKYVAQGVTKKRPPLSTYHSLCFLRTCRSSSPAGLKRRKPPVGAFCT